MLFILVRSRLIDLIPVYDPNYFNPTRINLTYPGFPIHLVNDIALVAIAYAKSNSKARIINIIYGSQSSVLCLSISHLVPVHVVVYSYHVQFLKYSSIFYLQEFK